MRLSLKSIAALAAVAAIAITAIAAAASSGPTQITVEPAATLKAGDKSPGDIAGVKVLRRGKAIPKGYVLIGQTVTIKRGTIRAGAALFFTCPDGKRLKSFATIGTGAATVNRNYVNHRQMIIYTYTRSDKPGVVYAVCR